ncbi:hypothetical protein FGO68_gene14594 [Halteria grandinella]|uniref:Casein kinase I n=1 Tax=Halteria grandinella TaxID=5974 RepID=A0A8J8P4K5_HALGN|nr:hypothetical protein FGO68_gene14594 [Halteria grandinella]
MHNSQLASGHQQQHHQNNQKGSSSGGVALNSQHILGGAANNKQMMIVPRELTKEDITLHGEIGHGGFCKVYEGTIQGIPQRVAIKATQKMDVIKTEIEVLKKLNTQSPSTGEDSHILGLPALLGYGKVNHFEFMVMPLYGRTLKEIMLGQQSAELRRFSLKTVCQIGLQLLDSLSKIHSIGFAHCDLKPDNILLDDAEHNQLTNMISSPNIMALDQHVPTLPGQNGGINAQPDNSSMRPLILIDFGLSSPFLIQTEEEVKSPLNENKNKSGGATGSKEKKAPKSKQQQQLDNIIAKGLWEFSLSEIQGSMAMEISLSRKQLMHQAPRVVIELTKQWVSTIKTELNRGHLTHAKFNNYYSLASSYKQIIENNLPHNLKISSSPRQAHHLQTDNKMQNALPNLAGQALASFFREDRNSLKSPKTFPSAQIPLIIPNVIQLSKAKINRRLSPISAKLLKSPMSCQTKILPRNSMLLSLPEDINRQKNIFNTKRSAYSVEIISLQAGEQ